MLQIIRYIFKDKGTVLRKNQAPVPERMTDLIEQQIQAPDNPLIILDYIRQDSKRRINHDLNSGFQKVRLERV